jgi:AcrR family transcriptional regulator
MAKTKTDSNSPAAEKRYAKRKDPRQKRSLNTVESIKQAAVLLMQQKGMSDVGTHEIAEKAGVSIGSLYQYFPNREAIMVSLYEDVSSEYAGILKLQIPKLVNMSTAQAVKKTVTMLADMHDRHRLVLLQLASEMPQLRLDDQPLSFSRLAHSSTRAYLMSRPDSNRPRDLERKSFFLEQIILGCVNAYLSGEFPQISRDEFTRDLSRIITAYLDDWRPRKCL